MDFYPQAKTTKENFSMNSNNMDLLPISDASFRILFHLKRQKLGFTTSVRRICALMHISPKKVTRALHELEEKKIILVERTNGKPSVYKFAPDSSYESIIKRYGDEVENTIQISTESASDCGVVISETVLGCGHIGNTPPPKTETGCGHIGNATTPQNGNTNNTKNKTKHKTKYTRLSFGQDVRPQTKYRYDEWHTKLAENWHRHFKNISPNSPDQNLEKWANEIRLTSAQYKLDEKMFNAVFNFVENDSFWASNALSPMGLRTKNKSDIPKLINILKAMPEYNMERLRHNAATGYRTAQQQKHYDLLKEIGL